MGTWKGRSNSRGRLKRPLAHVGFISAHDDDDVEDCPYIGWAYRRVRARTIDRDNQESGWEREERNMLLFEYVVHFDSALFTCSVVISRSFWRQTRSDSGHNWGWALFNLCATTFSVPPVKLTSIGVFLSCSHVPAVVAELRAASLPIEKRIGNQC